MPLLHITQERPAADSQARYTAKLILPLVLAELNSYVFSLSCGNLCGGYGAYYGELGSRRVNRTYRAWSRPTDRKAGAHCAPTELVSMCPIQPTGWGCGDDFGFDRFAGA